MTDFRHRQANGDSGRWQGVMGDGCARWQKYWSHPSPTIPKLEKTKDHKWKLLGLRWTSETVIPGKFWECWSVSRTVNLYWWWHNNKDCWQGSPPLLCIKMTAWQEEKAFSINMAPHWLLKALLVSFFYENWIIVLLRDVLCFMKHTWIVGIVRHRWLNLFCNHIFIFFLSLVYFWPQLFLELLWLLMAHICIKNCWEGVFTKFLEIIFWYICFGYIC